MSGNKRSKNLLGMLLIFRQHREVADHLATARLDELNGTEVAAESRDSRSNLRNHAYTVCIREAQNHLQTPRLR